MTVLRPIGNASYLYSGARFTKDFVVIVPKQKIDALNVRILVQYVRSTRILFGDDAKIEKKSLTTCQHNEDGRFSWDVGQSNLRTFTNGPLILYSDWCAQLSNPFIGYGISGVQNHQSYSQQKDIADRWGVLQDTRSETFLLR